MVALAAVAHFHGRTPALTRSYTCVLGLSPWYPVLRPLWSCLLAHSLLRSQARLHAGITPPPLLKRPHCGLLNQSEETFDWIIRRPCRDTRGLALLRYSTDGEPKISPGDERGVIADCETREFTTRFVVDFHLSEHYRVWKRVRAKVCVLRVWVWIRQP